MAKIRKNNDRGGVVTASTKSYGKPKPAPATASIVSATKATGTTASIVSATKATGKK